MNTHPVTTATMSEHEAEYVPTWADAERVLESAEMYWITSLHNGEPHTVPVSGSIVFLQSARGKEIQEPQGKPGLPGINRVQHAERRVGRGRAWSR